MSNLIFDLGRRLRGSSSDSVASKKRECVIFHALHKSASTFLFQFFDDLYRRLDRPVFSIHHQPPNEKEAIHSEAPAMAIGPVRSLDLEAITLPEVAVRHLVQVRDPRDILVSEYFSLGWRHSDATWSDSDQERRARIQQVSIDEYVLNQSRYAKYPLLERFLPILRVASRSDALIVKYETMVCDFEQWLDKVIAFLDLPSRRKLKRRLTRKYRDEFVADASPNSHKRRVTPGDYLDKLQPDTIRRLNEEYRPVLEFLDYTVCSDAA